MNSLNKKLVPILRKKNLNELDIDPERLAIALRRDKLYNEKLKHGVGK